MKPIFEYIDYRRFLKDYYDDAKANTNFFSYRYFAQKAELNSPILLKMIIDGKRNLGNKTIEKFIKGLNLKEKEGVFFRNLVLFNQATTANEKQQHYIVLRSLSEMVPQHLIKDEFLNYFDKWYYSVLREGICQCNYRDNWSLIASRVCPAITAREAHDAVQWLISNGFLKRDKHGNYEQIQKAITTRSKVKSLAVRNFNRKMLELAGRSLDTHTVEQRYATGVTVGISSEGYTLLVAEIEAFRDRIVQMVNNLDRGDRVYQVGIQIFPLMQQPDQD